MAEALSLRYSFHQWTQPLAKDLATGGWRRTQTEQEVSDAIEQSV
jgi:hypothetical protein